MSCQLQNILWQADSAKAVLLFDTISNDRIFEIDCYGKNEIIIAGFSDGYLNQKMPKDTLVPFKAMFDFKPIILGDTLDDYFPLSGKLIITSYDSIQKKVSGRFESKLWNWGGNGNDTVTVSSAYFKNVSYDIFYD
jgi:hypothetical protein